MPKYTCWLPTWASVKWELATQEPITDFEELKRRLLDEGEPQGTLCHSCSDDLELDPSNVAEENWKPEPGDIIEEDEG